MPERKLGILQQPCPGHSHQGVFMLFSTKSLHWAIFPISSPIAFAADAVESLFQSFNQKTDQLLYLEMYFSLPFSNVHHPLSLPTWCQMLEYCSYMRCVCVH